MIKSHISKADLRFSSFKNSNLLSSSFINCDCQDSDFMDADIRFCTFMKVNLSGHARFNNAIASDTIIDGKCDVSNNLSIVSALSDKSNKIYANMVIKSTEDQERSTKIKLAALKLQQKVTESENIATT